MIPERGFRGTERGPRGKHNAKVPFLAEDESVKAKRGRKQAVPLYRIAFLYKTYRA